MSSGAKMDAAEVRPIAERVVELLRPACERCGRFFRALRAELIAAYGGACVCCGEREPTFLDLDHINNDGKADRTERGNGRRLYVWLKANGWPRERYQLLCCNCNQGKARNGGVCPHVRRRDA